MDTSNALFDLIDLLAKGRYQTIGPLRITRIDVERLRYHGLKSGIDFGSVYLSTSHLSSRSAIDDFFKIGGWTSIVLGSERFNNLYRMSLSLRNDQEYWIPHFTTALFMLMTGLEDSSCLNAVDKINGIIHSSLSACPKAQQHSKFWQDKFLYVNGSGKLSACIPRPDHYLPLHKSIIFG